MTKKKSVKEVVEQNDGKLFDNNELVNNEFDVVAVEDTPTVAEVHIEAELDPENPNTEKSLMTAKVEISPEPEKPKDSKLAILEEFAAIMRKYGRHGLVSAEIGEQIWNLWRAYTGRQDKWRRCSSCLIPRAQRLIKECQRFDIPIR